MSVTFRTNAKVNLFLRVLGRRADGYHEIESTFHSVGLADDITIEATEGGQIEVTMAFAEGATGTLPEAADNLVTKAAGLLANKMIADESPGMTGVSFHISKRIPIAAGLGGGSGNAAGALVALNSFWAMGLERSALREMASEIGSDVGYCIEGGAALATGRGDQLTHLAAPNTIWFVLGISSEPLYTKDVYEAWDDIEQGPAPAKSAPMTLALGAGDVHEIAALLHNDLEPAAFSLRPELLAKKKVLLEAGALGACLSGSGPTLYAVCADEAAARSLAGKVTGQFDRVEVADPRHQCVEMPSGS